MSIPAIKAVGIGKGPEVARLPGSRIHDEIVPRTGQAGTGHPAVGVARLTNNAGGLEGGVTNGEQLRISGYMKPIATLMKPLRSVDLTTLEESPAAIERSDVCAVTAAAVVGEAMVSLALADAFLEKFTGDNLGEISRVVEATSAAVRARFAAAAASTPAGA
jgi:chorismate synthase